MPGNIGLPNILIIFIALCIAGVGVFLYLQSIQSKGSARKKAEEMDRRMYELAILKELGERAGYSLNVENIADIITGSLHQFIEYSAVSYMLLGPEKIIFKIHLEKSVHRTFVDEIKERMLKSLSALLGEELEKYQVDEILSGAVLIEEMQEPVQSFFNIPLVIGEKVVGVLTVAHTQAGLYKEEEMTILYKITQQASRAVSRLQEVVRTEQGKLNAMVQSMTEGVAMTDTDYRILVVNPVAKRIIGLPDKEDITIFDFIDNLEGKFDIRGKLEESVKLDRILESGDIIIGDQYYQIFVSPVKSAYGAAHGEILGGVVIFHDITHEKELERLREDFTSMMVHELRSPLGGIRKVMELIMRRGGELDSEKLQKEYVPMIYKSSSDMLDLINDLLDVAKIEAGKFSVFKEPGNLNRVIEERAAFFASAAKDADVPITTHYDPKLPEQLEFDPGRISQVFNNLISNAIKFTPAGGKISISAFSHAKGNAIAAEAQKSGIDFRVFEEDEKNMAELENSVIVAVRDSGVGIQKENVGQLFNKFKQFKAAMTSEQKGTGLGLSVVKGIVEAHGGIVGVASEEGAGSTFYFTLPIGLPNV
ncbi:MAG: ATP-binding protein [bacterium]|nr:ATP-binding protein [bacterium]